MMGWLKGLKNLVVGNLFAKTAAVLISGNIGQKVAVILGFLGIVVGIWQAFIPLMISVAGLVIVQIAINDFENSKKEDD